MFFIKKTRLKPSLTIINYSSWFSTPAVYFPSGTRNFNVPLLLFIHAVSYFYRTMSSTFPRFITKIVIWPFIVEILSIIYSTISVNIQFWMLRIFHSDLLSPYGICLSAFFYIPRLPSIVFSYLTYVSNLIRL